jgi:hypothetical protein
MFFLIFPLAAISIFLPIFGKPSITHYLAFSIWVSLSFLIYRKTIKTISVIPIVLLSIIIVFIASAFINNQNISDAILGKNNRNSGIGSLITTVIILLIIQNSKFTIADFNRFALWPLSLITIVFGLTEITNVFSLKYESDGALELYIGNSNFSAQIIAILCIFHLAQLYKFEKVSKLVINLICALILIFLGVATRSSQFYTLLIFTLIVLLLMVNQKKLITTFSKIKIIQFSLILCLSFLSLIIIYRNQISAAVNLKDRVLDFRTGIQIGLEYSPFGVGIDRFYLYSPMWRSLEKNIIFESYVVPDKSHNLFIDYFAEGGFLAVVLLILLVVVSLQYALILLSRATFINQGLQTVPIIGIWLVYIQQLFYSPSNIFIHYLAFYSLGFIVRDAQFPGRNVSTRLINRSITKVKTLKKVKFVSYFLIIAYLIFNFRVINTSFQQQQIITAEVRQATDIKRIFLSSPNLRFREIMVVELIRDRSNCPLAMELATEALAEEARAWNFYYFLALCEDSSANYAASIEYIDRGLFYYPSNTTLLEARFLLEMELSLIDDARDTLALIKYYKPNYPAITKLENALTNF